MKVAVNFSRIAAPSPVLAGTFVGVLLLLGGCASGDPQTRVIFENTTINEKPAKLFLDTGSPNLWIFQTSAEQLGLKFSTDYTAPAKLSAGANVMTTPFLVETEKWYMGLMESKDLDGSLGWPDVRDNILVFDADSHVVRQAPELPADAAQWLKLKISPGNYLVLEIPQPDGRTGKILIDTGSPLGVALPPAHWQQWRQAHPDAPSTTRLFGLTNNTVASMIEAWANEINLGPLSLTDVPVHEASVIDLGITGNEHYAGTLGMYALERMDLIVDGKNGFAYLRPRPPPGPPYPGMARPEVKTASGQDPRASENWTVAKDVRLSLDQELPFVADSKMRNNDIPGAIQDCTQALAADPDNPHAYFSRGSARAMEGDTAGALADLSECIRLDPTNSAAYLNRGIIEARKGDYPNSIADCNQGLELNPQNATAYLLRAMDRQTLGDFAKAASDYAKALELNPAQHSHAQIYLDLMQRRMGLAPKPAASGRASWKNAWAKSLDQFVIGAMDEASLLDLAKKLQVEPVPSQECEAFYLIGERHLIQGDTAGARAFFQKCLETGQSDHNEYGFARAELARLAAP
jgi:tetratricopeptide (TPR) repeat protein